MIDEKRLSAFINSLDKGNPEYLNEIENKALFDNVPIIRKETQSLLRFFVKSKKPKKILEVGTAIGFSALLMREYGEGVLIDTIEKYEKRIPIALENFKRFDKDGQIVLHQGDATEILSRLDDKYDLIFMDAAKAQYINFLPDVLRLLADGGILISDNILQDRCILESKFAVERRDRTIHKRMREYLYALETEGSLTTIILPVGDGVSVSVKE